MILMSHWRIQASDFPKPCHKMASIVRTCIAWHHLPFHSSPTLKAEWREQVLPIPTHSLTQVLTWRLSHTLPTYFAIVRRVRPPTLGEIWQRLGGLLFTHPHWHLHPPCPPSFIRLAGCFFFSFCFMKRGFIFKLKKYTNALADVAKTR